jgi:hypothetical protein
VKAGVAACAATGSAPPWLALAEVVLETAAPLAVPCEAKVGGGGGGEKAASAVLWAREGGRSASAVLWTGGAALGASPAATAAAPDSFARAPPWRAGGRGGGGRGAGWLPFTPCLGQGVLMLHQGRGAER